MGVRGRGLEEGEICPFFSTEIGTYLVPHKTRGCYKDNFFHFSRKQDYSSSYTRVLPINKG